MPLPQGTRLGPYEIDLPLGGGRQGDVYAARDTRLDRDVAIKVLSEDYSHSAEDLERFRREARTLSALSHPHICTLYDIGREGAVDFLVMERVEGETLSQRFSRGPLPIADALKFGAQIADALGRAHRAGVVHRDLKPLNLMLTKSGAKLMDFGLASALRTAKLGGSTATALPHLEDSVTTEGMIVGTVPYMAPEQLEGRPADGRVDIWALGCVLYEMVTRRRAFEGATQPELISAIMRGEPPAMSELEPLAPPALERAVRQCLAKDPDDRWQTADDLRRELLWIAESGSRTGVPATLVRRRKGRERLAWGIAAVAVVAAVGFAVKALQPRPEPKPVTLEVETPPRAEVVDVPRLSPDGRHLAVVARDSAGVQAIWVRHLSTPGMRRIPGTEGALRSFWSPDSRFLAYFANGRLYKLDIATGSSFALCDAPRADLGTWGTQDVIVFDWQSGDSIQSVSVSGGVPRGLAVIDHAKGETAAWPEFLPDGRHFLYLSNHWTALTPATTVLKVASIDGGEPEVVGEVGSAVVYASGHLLYVRNGALFAQKFDVRKRRFVGEPFTLAEDVAAVEGAAQFFKFSASTEGTLAYQSYGGVRRLVWVDRNGAELGTVGGSDRYGTLALSPDDRQLAVAVHEGNTVSHPSDIWIWDLERNLSNRLTSTNRFTTCPVWSPEGSSVAYSVVRGDFADIYLKPVQGGAEMLLWRSDHQDWVSSWSADGRVLSFQRITDSSRASDGYALILGDSARAVPLVATDAFESHPMLSPDGRLVAYASTESGRVEIYVRTISGGTEKWRVSNSTGNLPRWRGDGRELYYLTLDRRMMAVSIESGSTLRFSAPRELFRAPIVSAWVAHQYDVTKTGERFLFVAFAASARLSPTTVVVDWLGRLGKR